MILYNYLNNGGIISKTMNSSNYGIIVMGILLTYYGVLEIFHYFEVRRTGIEIVVGKLYYHPTVKVLKGKFVKKRAIYWLISGIVWIIVGLFFSLLGYVWYVIR
jgi:hypothetical protein